MRFIVPLEAAGSDPAMSMRLSNDYFDFLGEYGAICKMALARESGPPGGLFDGKNRESKIS
jgi:hypothetical protein